MPPRFLSTALVSLLALLTPAARAQLRCEPSVVDFGRKAENQDFTARVRLTNVTTGRVNILGVQADCGCITADTDIRVLDPGESTTLNIRMQSGGLEGQYQHTVQVTTAEGASAVLAVKMGVYRFVNWALDPSRLILSPSDPQTEVTADLHVTRVGSGQLGIVSVACDSPYIAVIPGGSGGDAFIYRVRKLRGAPVGPIYASVTITTNDPAAPILVVPVFAYVIPSKG